MLDLGKEMPKKKKRHSAAEIAAKLSQAAELATQGRNQIEIAEALGISVMTFHRWRKAMAIGRQPAAAGEVSGRRFRADAFRALGSHHRTST